MLDRICEALDELWRIERDQIVAVAERLIDNVDNATIGQDLSLAPEEVAHCRSRVMDALPYLSTQEAA